MEVIGKDYNQLQVFATEFLINDKTLHFVVSDSKKNLQVFTYAPRDPESYSGQKLLVEGDIHLGHLVNRFLRMQRRPYREGEKTRQQLAWFAGSNGAIGFISPAPEEVFRRLLALQTKMNSYLAHYAGLNPRGFRLFRPEFKLTRPAKKNILDGELLARFPHLGLNDQKQLCHQIGSTPDRVTEDLLELDFGAELL